MKILVHLEVRSLVDDPVLAAALTAPGYKAKEERGMVLHLEAFDWNCSQHITPRFTKAEVEQAVAPLRERLSALEAENQLLRSKLAMQDAVEGGSGVERRFALDDQTAARPRQPGGNVMFPTS